MKKTETHHRNIKKSLFARCFYTFTLSIPYKICTFAADMSEKKVVWFVVNPISGTTDKKNIVSMIPEFMDKDHFDYTILYTSHRGHAAEISCRAIEKRVDVVVAVGGDGTVNEVAKSLVHTDTALGIIPCGSGNGLARHLFIPLNVRSALGVLSRCNIKSLDYGRINGTPFFCTCGIGFDAFVSSKFAESGRRGLLSYMENTLREGLNYKPDTYEIEIDGERQKYKAFLIACANASQYGNNAYIAPDASMSDGLMDVTIMEPFTMLEAPQIAIQLFNKTLTKNSRIRNFKCQQLRIHRSSAGVIHFDGDPKQESQNLQVELVPQGIKIVVNDEEQVHVPPLLRAFTDLYNDMNEEFSNLRQDFLAQQERFRTINKDLLRKLRQQK